MDYKAEPLETNFGKGVKIEKGRRSYEQFSCRDGLFARVYQAPYKTDGQLINTDYHGVIFRAPFQDTDQDYEQFRVLAERLQQASGEEVPNSKARFMNYISHSGLEQELSRIGANVRINLKDRQDRPDKMESWLNSRGHWGGLVSDLTAYALGFGIISHQLNSVVEDNAVLCAYIMYGVCGAALEGVSGIPMDPDSKIGWCGPIHALGFVPTKRFFKRRIKNPNYMLGKFMQNYQRLDAMEQSHQHSPSVKSAKMIQSQGKKADRHFGFLEDMFPFTRHQRGFSITYDSPDRDNIINFFDYVLEGRNTPQLPNPQARDFFYPYTPNIQKPETQEKPVEIEPAETNFINPWEVQIPKLGGKKNE